MRPRPCFWRFAFAAAAVAGALAIPALPAVASAATPAAAIVYSPGTGSAAVAAAATCATSRPHSGTILHSEIRGGPGTLTIKNNLSQDAAIVLVLGRSKALSVYVRTHASTTVGNIKDGTYSIYFTDGSGFSVCQGRFTSGASYWRVDKHLTVTSQFTTWILTLYAVNGNASNTPISPGGFPTP